MSHLLHLLHKIIFGPVVYWQTATSCYIEKREFSVPFFYQMERAGCNMVAKSKCAKKLSNNFDEKSVEKWGTFTSKHHSICVIQSFIARNTRLLDILFLWNFLKVLHATVKFNVSIQWSDLRFLSRIFPHFFWVCLGKFSPEGASDIKLHLIYVIGQ